MERIIIREQDNTFNVEALSSYDVAYVPGFGSSTTLFRTPTLVTSKYKFLELFGENVPRFPETQDYPQASTSDKGFPDWAIPGYQNLVIDSTPVMPINELGYAEFTEFGDGVEFFFENVDLTPVSVEEDWAPEPGVNYFELMTIDNGTTWQLKYSTLPKSDSQTYQEAFGNTVYRSRVNPRDMRWYESKGIPMLTADTQINVESGTNFIKQYYQASRSTPPMFNRQDADPGYRYALYLLSLGMPVYYEQMNSPTMEEIDLTSNYSTAFLKYATKVRNDEGEVIDSYISPYDRGWYTYDESAREYVKWRDAETQFKENDAEEAKEYTFYSGADISVDSLYTGLSKRFMSDPDTPDYSFDSMGDYSIKYITSGGYPTFEYGTINESSNTIASIDEGLSFSMIEMASRRGDSVALIDHTNNPERSIYEFEDLSVINRVRESFSSMDDITSSYGAMFTPWYSCTHSAVAGEPGQDFSPFMPASLAFLSALATQVRNNQTPWLAASGVSRGKVPYFGSLHTNQPLTNNVADSYQTIPSDVVSEYALVSINPITYIRQYGYCIWGNRTLRNNMLGTKATSFLNIRNLVSDIKKRLYEASQQLLFEQNTEILWVNFKGLITPLLDTMVSNNILSAYKLTKYNIDPESGEPVPAYKVLANIEIRPINSVEVFDLTIQIENNEVEVSEVE